MEEHIIIINKKIKKFDHPKLGKGKIYESDILETIGKLYPNRISKSMKQWTPPPYIEGIIFHKKIKAACWEHRHTRKIVRIDHSDFASYFKKVNDYVYFEKKITIKRVLYVEFNADDMVLWWSIKNTQNKKI